MGNKKKPPTPEQVSAQVQVERARQMELGYDEDHDDRAGADRFAFQVGKFTGRAQEAARIGARANARQAWIKVAALAIAAVESIDRKEARSEDDMRRASDT